MFRDKTDRMGFVVVAVNVAGAVAFVFGRRKFSSDEFVLLVAAVAAVVVVLVVAVADVLLFGSQSQSQLTLRLICWCRVSVRADFNPPT